MPMIVIVHAPKHAEAVGMGDGLPVRALHMLNEIGVFLADEGTAIGAFRIAFAGDLTLAALGAEAAELAELVPAFALAEAAPAT